MIDTVVDTSGAQSGLDLATDIVRRGGRINLFGWIKGDEARFDPSVWHGKGITVVNSSPSAALRDPFPAAHVIPISEYPAFMTALTHGEIDGYLKGVVKH